MILYKFLFLMALSAFGFSQYCAVQGCITQIPSWWFGYLCLVVLTAMCAWASQVSYDEWKE